MAQSDFSNRPNVVVREIQNTAMAWQAFTALKLPGRWMARIEASTERGRASLRYVPLVGIIIGGIAALAWWGSYYFKSDSLSALIAVSLLTILTAAFHEKGLAALYRPNRTGGILTAVIIFLLKWQTLLLVPDKYIPWTLIAGAAFSRFTAVAYILGREQVTGSFVLAAAFGIIPFALFGKEVFLLIIPILWTLRDIVGWLLMKKFGESEGHCLDAVQQIIELGVYLAVAIITHLS